MLQEESERLVAAQAKILQVYCAPFEPVVLHVRHACQL